MWWCNADFDLTLAHGGGKLPAKIREAAAAPTWALSFWPALAPDDILLLPPLSECSEDLLAKHLEDFRAYLGTVGLRAPRMMTAEEYEKCAGAPRATMEVSSLSAALFTPFGWNTAAVDMMGRLGFQVAHPDPAVVKRVNSRAFSAALELAVSEAVSTPACPAVFCESRKAVRAWLEAARPGRYVAKGNHGLAGIGQVRFALDDQSDRTDRADRAPRLSAVLSTLGRLADRHEGLVIEEECRVTREWGVLFRVARDGRRSPVRRHRLLTEAGGGYAGALVLPEEQAAVEVAWNRHRDVAEASADAVAAALHREGYRGPVGLDMFEHERDGASHLRSLVDLNARQSMAWPAHGLASRFSGRAILFRQFPATSLAPCEDYCALSDILSYNQKTQRGAIRISPLLPLARVSMAFIGADEDDVLAVQDEFLQQQARL